MLIFMEKNQNMSQDFNIGDRIQTLVSPLDDEYTERGVTPKGTQGTILAFMREKKTALILFDEKASYKHSEGTLFGVSYGKAFHRCWWVSTNKLALAKQLTPEEKQILKEQSIVKKCKDLDDRFKNYQKTKKDYPKKIFSFSDYCKGNY